MEGSGVNQISAEASASEDEMPKEKLQSANANGKSSTVLLICDNASTGAYLSEQFKSQNLTCIAQYYTKDVDQNIAEILTTIRDQRPELVWMSLMHYENKGRSCLSDRTQVAARLIISTQDEMHGKYLLEDSNLDDTDSRGVFLSQDWRDQHQTGHCTPIWWCALGLNEALPHRSGPLKCSYTSVFTNLNVQERLFSCCQRAKFTGRSLLPSRMPKAYYAAMTSMIEGSLDTSKAKSVSRAKKAKPKPPRPSPDDGPGEHAEMGEMDKPLKYDKIIIDNVYDDCGDDTSTIFVEDSESYLCFDSEDEDDRELDFVYTNLESDNDYDSMFNLYHSLEKSKTFAGQHDLCEVFGGANGTTKVCIRRGMSAGPSFDLQAGIDLTSAKDVAALWDYVRKYRPKVLIMGPPCTSFGPWSRINRHRGYQKWAENRRIGEQLAHLTLQLCLHQLSMGLHFLVENPAQSELWLLQHWAKLLSDPRVFQARLDQCQVGLVDPQGLPTRKATLMVASSDSLVRRLRLRCPNLHRHALLAGAYKGIARCRFAQVWPHKLCSLIADGISETLQTNRHKQRHYAFPVRRVPAIQDVYGGRAKKPEKAGCLGCRMHLRKQDQRHNRVAGECRFPYDETVTWTCPSCIKNRPSTHSSHTFELESCQWASVPSRPRGGTHLPGALREPRMKANIAPQIATSDPEAPPPVDTKVWTPVQALSTIINLNELQARDGWHQCGPDRTLTITNGRALQGPAPRLEPLDWQYRSTYGLFPDNTHKHGQWWQLEQRYQYTTTEAETDRKAFGYPVPVLIMMFHKESEAARPKENIMRDAADDDAGLPASSSTTAAMPKRHPSKSNPMTDLTDKWREEEWWEDGNKEQADDGGEPNEDEKEAETLEHEGELAVPDINIVPEWSSFDMGSSLRALRAGTIPQRNRALRRLHLRWWHATGARMTSLLRAAGVPVASLNLISSIVETCAICRQWQRVGPKSMVSTQLANAFNQRVQCDLLFVEDHIILHLIDEQIRWTMTSVLPDKQAESILRAITQGWCRMFGPMSVLVSDQEGGLTSDQAAIWAERWKVSFLLKAKNQHANIVERHHELMRVILHKILAQARSESLVCSFDDILAEGTFVKNAMTTIGGTTPYVALLGRFPQILSEFENQTISGAADDTGGAPGTSQYVNRLRELAVMAITEATASSRLRLANKSKTALAGEAYDYRNGELVDLFRQPSSKDLSGWRGPATIVDVSTLQHGHLSVRWGGRTISVRLQDLRRSIVYFNLVDDGSAQLQYIRAHLLNMYSTAPITVAWVMSERGWKLSKAAQEQPLLFQAVLHTAVHDLSLVRCLGARLGRSSCTISGLDSVELAFLVYWPADSPKLFRSLQHDGMAVLDLKPLFQDMNDVCWIQFLCTTTSRARKLRRIGSDVPYIAYDPDDREQESDDDRDTVIVGNDPRSPMDTRSDGPRTASARPMTTNSDISTPDWSMVDPFNLPDSTWRDVRPTPTANTSRSRTTRTDSTINPTPVVSRDGQRRSVPSTAESNPKSGKKYRESTDDTTTATAPTTTINAPTAPMGPSASTAPAVTQIPNISTAAAADAPQAWLPNDPEGYPIPSNASEASTLNYDEVADALFTHNPSDYEPMRRDMWASHHVYYSEGIGLRMAFLADDGTPVVSRDLDELSKADVEANWPKVESAVRADLKSFSDFKAFKVMPAGTSKNTMSSRWVLRWKMIMNESSGKYEKNVKARLTVHGFKDREAETLTTFASTASRWSQRLVTAMASQYKWELLTADIGNAFLRGMSFSELSALTGEPTRTAGFLPPKGYESYIRELPGCSHFDPLKHELFLDKGIYGLKDAPRAWRIRLGRALEDLGFYPLVTDASVYCKCDKTGQLCMILSVHVDDLKIAAEKSCMEWFLNNMTSIFGKLKIQRRNFEHCGVMYDQHDDFSVDTHQNHYTTGLKTVSMVGVDVANGTLPLSASQYSDYLSLLGGLSWLSQTRMDACIYIQALQRAASKPTIAHLVRLNCVTKWVKRKPFILKFQQLLGPIKVLVISDSAFRREDKSGLAMRGAVVGLCESRSDNVGGRIQMLEWYSRRQRRIVRSTFGAELNALCDALEVGRLLQLTMTQIMIPGCTVTRLRELEFSVDLPISLEACIDCMSILEALVPAETKLPTEASLILLLLQVKELLTTGRLAAVHWLATTDMLADGLNKGIISRRALIDAAATGSWLTLQPAVTHREKSTSTSAKV